MIFNFEKIIEKYKNVYLYYILFFRINILKNHVFCPIN